MFLLAITISSRGYFVTEIPSVHFEYLDCFRINKLETPKGVLAYAPVDVSSHSLERCSTPP